MKTNLKSGTLTWSFSGGSAVTTTGAEVGGTNITENIEGSLQVNGNSYIASNTANYDGGGSSSSIFWIYTRLRCTLYSYGNIS